METDIVIVNGNVLTMDPGRPRASAVAIAGNRIVGVGTSRSLLARRSRSTKVIDALGATVMPGFNEAHCHVFPGSMELAGLNLAGIQGFERLQEAILSHANSVPGNSIIIGQQAIYGLLDGKVPTRHDLDRILPDRPILLFTSDHHTGFANTRALELASILQGQSLPPGNEIVLGRDGSATGELREMAAFNSVLALAADYSRARAGLATGGEPNPYPSPREFESDIACLRLGLKYLARHGITSFQNMDGSLYQCELLAELERRGELTCRAYMPFHFKPFMALGALERASTMQARYRSAMLKARAVKCFMDGVLDSYTAVMSGGFGDSPDVNGEPLFNQEQFNAVATDADRRKLQIAVHAIGDGAVNMALNGFEAARKKNGRRDSRHRVEHIETILQSDVKRFKTLGVLASMQPAHPPGLMGWPLEPTLSRIGEKRWPLAYAWQTLRKAGARLVFGTDWPVSDVSPFRSLHAAVTRQKWRDDLPDQRLNLADAIEAYTVGGAYAEFAETQKGQLKRGMLADVTVLNEDITSVATDDIQHVTAAATICDGKLVYGSDRV